MEDQDTEGSLRKLAAACMAQDFIIDYLLKAHFITLPKAERLKVAEGLLAASQNTSHFEGTARDDFDAEAIADVVVDAQSRIDQTVGEALQATEDAEGSWFPSSPRG